MKRHKPSQISGPAKTEELYKYAAYHEAGHAVAIYLNNKRRHLPPVFFRIILNEVKHKTQADENRHFADNVDYIAKVEGGRLIQTLPASIDEFDDEFGPHNEQTTKPTANYLTAFEADIVNLLIGSLAEAKQVSEWDDEVFNIHLVSINALHEYGGTSDLALINEYLNCFTTSKAQRNEKLSALFTQAYEFVDNNTIWQKITRLANYMLDMNKHIIDSDEVITVLEKEVNYLEQWPNTAANNS